MVEHFYRLQGVWNSFPLISSFFRQWGNKDAKIELLVVKFRSDEAEKVASHLNKSEFSMLFLLENKSEYENRVK